MVNSQKRPLGRVCPCETELALEPIGISMPAGLFDLPTPRSPPD